MVACERARGLEVETGAKATCPAGSCCTIDVRHPRSSLQLRLTECMVPLPLLLLLQLLLLLLPAQQLPLAPRTGLAWRIVRWLWVRRPQ